MPIIMSMNWENDMLCGPVFLSGLAKIKHWHYQIQYYNNGDREKNSDFLHTSPVVAT